MARFVSGNGRHDHGEICHAVLSIQLQWNYSTIRKPAAAVAGVWHDNTNAIHDNLSPIDLCARSSTSGAILSRDRPSRFHFVIAHRRSSTMPASIKTNTARGTITRRPLLSRSAAASRSRTCLMCLNAGGGCGKDFVNPTAHGRFLTASPRAGHEIAETLTDPGAESSTRPGAERRLVRLPRLEIGDKCCRGSGRPGRSRARRSILMGNDGRAYPVQTL